MRIHRVPESIKNQDDGEEALMVVAKEVNVLLNKQVDIQKTHRLGKKKSTANTKSRPIIVRFTSHKKETRLYSTNPS